MSEKYRKKDYSVPTEVLKKEQIRELEQELYQSGQREDATQNTKDIVESYKKWKKNKNN